MGKMTEEDLERLHEALRLNAREKIVGIVNRIGEGWVKAPISGGKKAEAILEALVDVSLCAAMMSLKAEVGAPQNWLQDLECASNCSNLVLKKLNATLTSNFPERVWTVSVTSREREEEMEA